MVIILAVMLKIHVGFEQKNHANCLYILYNILSNIPFYKSVVSVCMQLYRPSSVR